MTKLRKSDCAILPLVLRRCWYDMIDKGGKREEYRANTRHWSTRMENFLKKFETGRPLVVAFQNAYQKPSMWFFVNGISLRDGGFCRHPEWGEPKEEAHFAISLGLRVEVTEN